MVEVEREEQKEQEGRPRHRFGSRAPVERGVEAVFLEVRPLIERTAASAGRRAGLLPQDIEDFVATIQLKLIDDDYAILRQHRGESTLKTFLTTVILNQLKDFCNQKWGKFRPSAKAKELGPAALALERLLVIEQLDLESAIDLLHRQENVAATPGQLRELAAQLPQRSPRREVGMEVLEHRAAPELGAAQRVEEAERAATSARLDAVLSRALASLSHEDLLLLKMHFRDGCTIATIAAALHLEQRSLYTRKEKCLRELRQLFAAQGLAWEEVQEVLGWQGHDFQTQLTPVKAQAGPSKY